MTPQAPASVVVIGAGVVGLCCAWHLARRGLAVTVLDPEPPGSGCSSGNAGALSPGSVAPLALPGAARNGLKMLLDPTGALYIKPRYALAAAPWLFRFVRSARPERVEQIARALAALLFPAIERHREIVEAVGAADLVREQGQLYLYRDAEQLKKDDAVWALRRKHGVRAEVVDEATIRAMEPAIGPAYTLGIHLPESGFCTNPLRHAQAIAGGVQRLGGRILAERALAIETAEGRVVGVRGDSGLHAVGHVVVAAGAWSAALLRPLGYRVPLESQRGYHVNIPDPGFTLSRPVVPADRKVFCTPMEGGLRVAGSVEFAGLRAPPTRRRGELLFGDLKAVFPQARTEGASDFWMGHRPCLPDSLPVVGPARAVRGLWFAFGHGHLGLTGSAPTGHVLGEAIAGGRPNSDLAPFAIERFA